MFGTHFYHKRIRTAVSVFGSLFNNLYVLRTNSAGEVISQVKCPLAYAPRRNFIDRLDEMLNGEDAERRVAIKLPRMSFEIVDMSYDPSRQLPKLNNFVQPSTEDARRKFYTSVPYNILFQLNLYAKTQDDALQMVEQILPYFAPQYTVTVKPFSDFPDIKEDVPISLQSVSFEDNYEGAIGDRRTIIYTLTFEMKIAFYGPDNTAPIIREVNNNFYNMENDNFLSGTQVTPTPVGVGPDSDFGFEFTHLDSAAS